MKIGIEIHQRIGGRKLFCDCPCESNETEQRPGAQTDQTDITITRRLHPVFSEIGEVDEASQAEFAKGRVFSYQVFHRNNCLVETDEEPPKNVNLEALRVVMQVALQLHAMPTDEIQFMRKMVIDGSNTAGFQRTAIVALNGHLDTSKGTVGIPAIAIEEESAGIVSSAGSNATYSLDRLGIPLIEITTTPDIKDGAHLVEVAEKLGMILRATGKVARGIGTIRQDVNISTEGGARVEIKGAQDLKMLPLLVETEANRQLALVKLLAEIRGKKAIPIKKHIVDVTGVFAKNVHAAGTASASAASSSAESIITQGIRSGASVLAQKLQSHKGLLGRELQKGKRYGTELSDYAKKAGVKGIIHSDENLAKYGIDAEIERHIRSLANASESDALVLVVAPKEQAEQAIGFVVDRANMDYVPEETRRANPDGTTTYMRPLPGRGRLYPETDVPPLTVTSDMIEAAAASESFEDKKAKLGKILNGEMATRILKSRQLHTFERLVDAGVDPMLAAITLEETLVALRREGIEFTDLEKTLSELFAEYKKGRFVKAAIPEVLKGMAKGASVESVLKVYRLQKITGESLDKLMEESRYDMKAIMQKYRLQVDPQEVSERLRNVPKKQETDYV